MHPTHSSTTLVVKQARSPPAAPRSTRDPEDQRSFSIRLDALRSMPNARRHFGQKPESKALNPKPRASPSVL